ncbi:hypothetical protein ACHAXA_009934 [Cyclostephanos tholiformis]|uniref:K Homology domain-containing protein n=1 Tax=Cyclostephanos tholiformis TaxID=382380 RepID=A0ABD3RXY5_9STRA
MKRIRATMEAGSTGLLPIEKEITGLPEGDGAVLATDAAADDDEDSSHEMSHDGSPQVRTIAIPRWLSTPEVTRYLVGTGGDRLKALEKEFECAIVITGQGSGSRDPKLPGYHLPHLLVTMTGKDVRSLGRLRQSIEHRLIDYVIENSPRGGDAIEGGVDGDGQERFRPPPSLGRLLYSLGISAADASPRTKDRRPDRTVLARSPTLHSLYERIRSEGGGGGENDDDNDNDDEPAGLKSRKVWMNVCELPQDPTTHVYHGRFLSSKSLRTYYRTTFKCRVDVYGVWGDDGGEGTKSGGIEGMMCAPYVLVTSDEKANVDRCLVHIEHRIREHEDKFGMSRSCGRRVLKGERPGRRETPRSSAELLGSGLMTPR